MSDILIILFCTHAGAVGLGALVTLTVMYR